MSQSADTADANAEADEDVDVVLESLCFSCPPTIVYWTMQTYSDSGYVDFEENEELCSLSLVNTAILDQCANGLPIFEMITTCHFPVVTPDVQRNSICLSLG